MSDAPRLGRRGGSERERSPRRRPAAPHAGTLIYPRQARRPSLLGRVSPPPTSARVVAARRRRRGARRHRLVLGGGSAARRAAAPIAGWLLRPRGGRRRAPHPQRCACVTSMLHGGTRPGFTGASLVVVVVVGGQFFCRLCWKWMDPGHNSSNQHVYRRQYPDDSLRRRPDDLDRWLRESENQNIWTLAGVVAPRQWQLGEVRECGSFK